jgi:hypothetical protein
MLYKIHQQETARSFISIVDIIVVVICWLMPLDILLIVCF